MTQFASFKQPRRLVARAGRYRYILELFKFRVTSGNYAHHAFTLSEWGGIA
jgi:hypothetical protein